MEKFRKAVISVVLSAYILCAFIFACPQSVLTRSWTEMCDKRLGKLGLFRNFGVMGSGLAHENHNWLAVVKFADGRQAKWIFPSISQCRGNWWDKDHLYSLICWQSYLCMRENPARWQMLSDAAQYIARIHKTPVNQPTYVTIYREDSEIVMPPEARLPKDDEPEENGLVYEYKVEPGDLQ